MNAKKNKNKQKQHKPPTPQPKQDVSELQAEKNEEKVEAPEKTKAKSEERVPEIVSEVVQPILEDKASEGDVPKKPKRNRGKKKKGDKGGEADETEEQKENVLGDTKTSEVLESKETHLEEKVAASPELTPVARKKKNKNKKNSEKAENTSDQEVKITPAKEGEEMTDLKIVTVVPVLDTAEESKSKKKNKKKKRTESERSERAEEILSCTSAFQKLLAGKDEKKETKPTEDSAPKDKEQIQPIQAVVESLALKEALKPEPVSRDKSAEKKHDEGGKSKKKNKKDKKHPPEEENEEQLKISETKSELPAEAKTAEVTNVKQTQENITPVVREENKTEEIAKAVTPTPMIEKEKSPKPKAKIAKPVEKKQKNKQDISSTENLPEKLPEAPSKKEETLISTEEVKITELKATAESVTTEKPAAVEQKQDINAKVEKEIQIVKEVKVEETLPDIEHLTDAAAKTDFIPFPESAMGKKRKKSPKPKGNKNADIKEQPCVAAAASTVVPEVKDIAAPEPFPQKQDLAPVAIATEETKINKPEPIALSFESLVPESQQTTQVNILETPEVNKEQETAKVPTEVEEKVTMEPAEKELIQIPQLNSSKKRKKSPKPQRKLEKTPEPPQLTLSTDTKNTKDVIFDKDDKNTSKDAASAKTPEQAPQEPDTPLDLPTLEDIEIRSVKADESEGSACSMTPDIHYPRASSQLLDDNNNTVIQDITGTDVKLNIPSLSTAPPLVQGSGETPLPQPSTTSGVTITEIFTPDNKDTSSKSTSKPEERTDLKTKVLDVNLGMEELRKSIERSLAELSSMERSEKEAEEQFLKAQAKLEKITEMATKKIEEKKETPPSDAQQVQSEPKVSEVKDKGIAVPAQEPKPIIKSEDVKPISIIASQPVPATILQKPEEPTSKIEEIKPDPMPMQPVSTVTEQKIEEHKPGETVGYAETLSPQVPPVPARKDNKGKNKKKKGKQESETTCTAPATTVVSSSTSSSATTTKESSQDTKKEENSEQKSDNNTQHKGKQQTQEKGKQQSGLKDEEVCNDPKDSTMTDSVPLDFEPVENFEDALYASVEESEQDVNKTFEIIANEAAQCDESQNPAINITAPVEDEDGEDTSKDTKQEKVNPVSQPKNLLGHPNIPARLNRTDYKKEKNKHQTPNTKQATVNIKDAVPIEVTKESKESQTENKRRFIKDKTVTESIASLTSENEEYIYKYSFRKVFLPSACHVCKKDLKATRVPCNFCNLVFYCSVKHKDEDYPQHQGLCFAVSTIVHLKDQKHIYADAKDITGHEYRLLRMQTIVSCEKVLKRRLVPWEQEALLYPRICADAGCREWRQSKLEDCEGCGQISYCSENPNHLPKTHQRWCKSYSLYNKLVVYQQTKGRLEPRLPTKVMAEMYQIPEKLNEVLASMYEEKIDMTDIQYAALTQIATAPLTAAYCHQIYSNKMNTAYANGVLKKSSFTIHVVGCELQFEADVLNKWEVFFLHLRPDVKDLRVVLVGPDLNPSKLPLELLAKIKMCENCRQNRRRVLFDFQEKKSYTEYWSTEFTTPDLICAFNPSIQRSSVFNGKDIWPATIKCVTKLKVPFLVTSHTISELHRDLNRIKECSDVEVNTIIEPEFNAFASVRPDRNFISDDEMPLLFKNFCFATVCGAF